MTLFFWIYNLLFIPLFYILIHTAALFNKKIRKGLAGRQGLLGQLAKNLQPMSPGKRVWIHVSSMGEYEQAKPVIDLLLEKDRYVNVILTVFSPSAYDHLKIDGPRILLTYLPMDTFLLVRRFIALVNPAAVLVVRHDIWPNFQWRLHKLGIPTFLIDASISNKRHWVYKLFRVPIASVMSTFDRILTVSGASAERFSQLFPQNQAIEVYGDTRYDRVVTRSQNLSKIQWLLDLNLFVRDKTLVLGSTWPSCEQQWLPVVRHCLDDDPQFKVVLAPHEVDKEHINAICTQLDRLQIGYITMSELQNDATREFKVLLVDRIGVLANLYTCGKLAYVGGGFGPGVHNVLEPAAHGCAVLFGPRHNVSVEPGELIDAGGGIVVNSIEDMLSITSEFVKDPASGTIMGKKACEFIEQHTGASAKITNCVLNEIGKE